jgi:uncharacterized protein GlcG (DUF336 family)
MKDSAILISLQKFLEACRANDLKMVICFVDRAGHPHLLWRETGAWLGSLDIARRKAWTAVAFSGPKEDGALTTEDLAKMAQPGESLYGIDSTNTENIVIFGGGIPVYVDGKLHGAIGVSGSTVHNDIKMAKVAVNAYLEALKANK